MMVLAEVGLKFAEILVRQQPPLVVIGPIGHELRAAEPVGAEPVASEPLALRSENHWPENN